MYTDPANTTEITGYMVYRQDNGGGFVAIDLASVFGLSYTDTNVSEGNTYDYYFTSRTLTDESIPSNILSITTGSSTVDPPTLDLLTEISVNEVQIDFTEPADTTNILSYDIERDDGGGFTLLDSVSVGTTTYNDLTVFQGQSYTYRIISQGISGPSIPSNELSITISTPSLDPPVLTVITVDQTTSINIKFLEPDDTSNISEYNVYREESGSGFVQIDSVSVGTTEYTDFSVTPSMTYSYYLTSVDFSAMESSQSNTLTETVGTGVLEPPVLDSLISFDEFTFELQFTEPADNTEIFEYEFLRSEDGISYFPIGSEPVGSTSFFDYVMPNITYFYQAISRGMFGESGLSNIISGQTSSTTLPEPPMIFDINTDGSTTLTIFWNPSPDGSVTNYQIERREEGVSSFTTIGTVSFDTFTFSDPVSPGAIYNYRIKSISPAGTGYPSEEFTGVLAIDETEMANVGMTLEPDATNNFDMLNSERFTQNSEFFNINSTSLNTIINDIEIKKKTAYEVILKMNNQTYDSSQEMLDLGTFYGAKYLTISNVTSFLSDIDDSTRKALGGSDGAGDNPQHAKEVPAET